MAPLAATLGGLTALAAVAFAGIVVAAGPRRPEARFLAATLACGGLAVLAPARDVVGEPWSGLLAAGASAAAALAAAFLYYFASLWPERNALNAPWRVAAVVGPGFLLAASFAIRLPDAPAFLRAAVLSLYTGAVAAVLLVDLARRFAADPDPRTRLLFPALWFLALPAVATAARQVVHGAAALAGRPPFEPATVAWASAAHLAVLALASAAALALARSAGPGARVVRRTVAAAFLLQLAFKLPEVPYFLGGAASGPDVSPFRPVIGVETALRWLLFGALVSAAILRHGMLGLGVRARRAAARVAVAAAFGVAAVVALEVARGLGMPSPTVGEVAVVAAALAVSQGFRTLVDRVAVAVYGLPREDGGHAGPLVPGALVHGRWRVLRLLGRGGSGRTFLARDERLGRDVALKEVLVEGDAEAATREARLAARVRHPRVVAVHDVLPDVGAALVVSEYVPGGSLAARISAGPVPEDEAARLVEDVLEGLAAVHAAGVVHGDVKPANVLLDATGARIADFGIAREGGGTVASAAEAFAGTPGAMAPEQARGDRATPASDVYGVGLLARKLRATWSEERGRVLAQALAEAPSSRYADAGAMLAAWRQAR